MKRLHQSETVRIIGVAILVMALVGSLIGATLVAGGGANEPSTTDAVTTQTSSPTTTPTAEPQEIEIVFERAGNRVSIAANGGTDLVHVTSFSIDGADVDESMDPSSEYPQTIVNIEPPTTVQVTATFDDGTTQVIAKKEFS